MKILVTGGAGYIGSVTANLLLESGHDVYILDNLSTGFRENIPLGARFTHGDVRDQGTIEKIMRQQPIDAVLHFAAKLIVSESLEQPFDYHDNNVVGTLRVLNACRACNIKNFIFSSTAAVYGNPVKLPIDEEAAVSPLNPYGTSKAMAELILADFQAAYGLNSVALRYFNVAGAASDLSRGQRTKKATHLIKVGVEAACGRRPYVTIYGNDYPTSDGTGVRDYIHVEDLASAHLAALNYLLKGGKERVFNCGYGHGYSVKQVLSSIEAVSGKTINKVYGPRRPGDAAEVVASSKKARQILNWTPQFDDLNKICQSAFAWERQLPETSLDNSVESSLVCPWNEEIRTL